MTREFPHLDGAGSFPGAGREVYEQIPGSFDYSRWEDTQAHIRLLCVPWCGDYDNVVDPDYDIDAWIDAQPCYQADTLWRRAPENTFNVDVPYTTALYYNYLVLDLPTETSAAQPLPNTNASERVSRLCYFVNDCRPISGSTTELEIELDEWTTFIRRMTIDYMQLAQGHAPVAEVSAATYLANPAANSAHLKTPDVSVSAAGYARYAGNVALNSGDMWFCIATTANWLNLPGMYGDVVAVSLASVQGTGAPRVWACDVADAQDFVSAINANQPSMMQTIRAAFFVQKSLVSTVGESYDFYGTSIIQISAVQQSNVLVALSTSDFGYATEYAGLAKLYTSPYAHLEITDGRGNTLRVNIEDTTGTLSVQTFVSLAFPYLAIDAQIMGVGAGSGSLTVRGLTDHTYAFSGDFYDLLLRFDIPCFEVYQSASTNYDWSAHYTNQQRSTAAANQLASSLASNSTAQTNAYNSADNVTANNALAVAANNALTSTANSTAESGLGYSVANITANLSQDNSISSASYEAEMAGLAVASQNNGLQAAASGVQTVVAGVAGTVAGALSGDVGGVVGSVAGTISGVVNTAVGWQVANSSNAVSQSNSTTIYNATISANNAKNNNNINASEAALAVQNAQRTSNNTTNNNLATSVASNNANLIETNADNIKTVSDANAQRTNSTNLAAITNDTAEAALGAPVASGTYTGNQSAVTKAMAVHCAVVTANPGDIARVGDTWLRFGYACDFNWTVSDWVPTTHFCYWRASDLWCAGKGNVSERHQQAIRDILLNGTTVWKNPDEIGQVSIYANGI